MERFPCPFCDHFTLGERAAWEICPVCYWEDDGQDLDRADDPSGCNRGLTLRRGRENFRQFGACAPEMVRYACPPEERRCYKHIPRDPGPHHP